MEEREVSSPTTSMDIDDHLKDADLVSDDDLDFLLKLGQQQVEEDPSAPPSKPSKAFKLYNIVARLERGGNDNEEEMEIAQEQEEDDEDTDTELEPAVFPRPQTYNCNDLFRSIEINDFESAAALIEYDPSLVHARSPDFEKPLAVAISSGATRIVKYLLHKQSSLVDLDVMGRNALHYAVQNVVELSFLLPYLLQKTDVGVNAQDSQGTAPIHLVPPNDRILKLLLYHGADPSLVNEAGESVEVLIEKKWDALTGSLLLQGVEYRKVKKKARMLLNRDYYRSYLLSKLRFLCIGYDEREEKPRRGVRRAVTTAGGGGGRGAGAGAGAGRTNGRAAVVATSSSTDKGGGGRGEGIEVPAVEAPAVVFLQLQQPQNDGWIKGGGTVFDMRIREESKLVESAAEGGREEEGSLHDNNPEASIMCREEVPGAVYSYVNAEGRLIFARLGNSNGNGSPRPTGDRPLSILRQCQAAFFDMGVADEQDRSRWMASTATTTTPSSSTSLAASSVVEGVEEQDEKEDGWVLLQALPRVDIRQAVGSEGGHSPLLSVILDYVMRAMRRDVYEKLQAMWWGADDGGSAASSGNSSSNM